MEWQTTQRAFPPVRVWRGHFALAMPRAARFTCEVASCQSGRAVVVMATGLVSNGLRTEIFVKL